MFDPDPLLVDQAEVGRQTHDHFHATTPMELAFEDIRMTVQGKKNANNGSGVRVLLDGSLRGRAKPGRMLAIMGPSVSTQLLCTCC